ncbi:MAG: hypothetical protein JWM76_3555 [Pseudonocardiales bacterium]|nr:hypothetical protein [Pseudonocardiales bacterium]
MNVPVSIRRKLPADRLSTWAVVGAGCGLLAAVPFLPSGLKALLLLTFVFVGPGSVIVDRFKDLPIVAVRALVPVIGLSVVILVVSLSLLLGVWSSRLLLLALAVVTLAVGLFNARWPSRTELVST